MTQQDTLFPADNYDQLLKDLKARVRRSQVRAALAINQELVWLYWQIGREILQRQQQEGWGAKVITRLAKDLKREFPDIKGFSSRNLKYMRAFAEAWPDEQFVQQLAAQIPWFHNCMILDKVKDGEQRRWYIQKTIENGWSRNILAMQIDSSLYQLAEIEHILDVCRKVWNYALRERKDWLDSRKCRVDACSIRQELILPADAPFPAYAHQCKALTAAKTEFPRLKSVNAQVLQQVLRKLENAWESWRLKRSGLPRFKTLSRMRSFVFPQMLKNCISGEGIKLPQLGLVQVRWSREIPDLFEVKQARIVRKASGYFVMLSLQADVDVPEPVPHGHPVGIDVGLEYFLSTSDGEQVKRPRFFDELHRKLKLLQRRLKKKQKGSANWLKLQKQIGRVHQRIADTRKDWHFKLAHHLCDRTGMIFVEDLDFRIMAKGMLGKHTLDAGLGQFTNQILPWVCFKRDVFYGKVDARGTSQECPDCGTAVRKDLSHRIHHCRACGSIKPRDIAAAQVISARGQRVVETACGGEAAGTGVTQSSWHLLKQEILGVTPGISWHTA